MNLKTFLVKAKKNTYASGKKPRALEDGFEEFVYEEGDYKYRDRYHARDPKPFGGQEVVSFKENPIWIMNYYGYILSDKIDSNKLYSFLRKAMRIVDERKPYRGSSLKEENLEYHNGSQGTINQFKGVERIFFNGEEVYRLEYHGGSL